VAEPEYLEFLQSKLLPYKLSFDDRRSICFTPASDTSQARKSELPPHLAIVDVQAFTTFLPTGSVQPETEINLFNTTLGDHHSSHNTASVNVDMLDCDSEDNSDALTGYRNTSQVIQPKLPSHPARVNSQPFASPASCSQQEEYDEDLESPPTNLFNDAFEDFQRDQDDLDGQDDQDDHSTSVYAEMPDYYIGEALTECCNTNDATLPVSVSSSETPNVLPVAGDSDMELNDIVTDSVTNHPARNESDLSEFEGEIEAFDKPSQQVMNTMDDRSSLRLSLQTGLGTLSPSPLFSDWHGSPRNQTEFTLPEGVTKTHWLHSYDQLNYLFGGTHDELCNTIKLGDSFLREDACKFISLFYQKWNLKDPWSRLLMNNPTSRAPLTERVLKSLNCAITLESDSIVDPVKLRIARVLLHHYFEQMCIELDKERSQCNLSSGLGVATVAKNAVLETVYGCRMENLTLEQRKKCEHRFAWHTQVGKRWSYVASHLGIGILLTCSRNLEIHM
jgi:hypothetical protein